MKKTVTAYVMDHNVPWLRAGDLMKLDALNYSFSTIKDGKPGLYGLRQGALIANVRKINPQLKVHISIGGWGAGGFSEAAMTAEGRALFTQSAMAMVREYDFDGLDMDWEYPCSNAGGIACSPDDKQNFTFLLEELRHELDKHSRAVDRPMLLSAAVASGMADTGNMEVEKIAKLLDIVNLMTYDIRGSKWSPRAGHHTNLYPQTGDEDGMCADKAVAQYAAAGVPIEKMVLGAAFYGHLWHKTAGINHPAEGGDTLRFTQIDRDYLPVKGASDDGASDDGASDDGASVDNTSAITVSANDTADSGVSANGFVRYWDKKACAPYLYNGTDFISYDDEESIAHKCRYVAEKGLAGIMFWEYGGDHTYRLLDAMTNAMNNNASEAKTNANNRQGQQ